MMHPRSRAVRLLLCALAMALWAPAQVFPPLQSESFDAAADGGLSLEPPRSLEEDSVETGVTIFDGQEVRYEVIDGLAITGGDIIIGTAEEAAEWSVAGAAAKSSLGGRSPRPKLALTADDRLWPRGIIPYVIDEELPEEQKQLIDEAIEAWNSRTVISLVERRREGHYLRFADASPCSATVGRRTRGGESRIAARSCGSLAAFLHEIGHSIGLHHEHQREDRERYMTLPLKNVLTQLSWWYISRYPEARPYNYRSIMHYPATFLRTTSGALAPMESIPPGMPIGWEKVLTPGDIDGVAHLYGMPPSETMISTNPPGLEIIVDGERFAAPASFEWTAGSEHVLEAPLLQSGGDTRYLFGRWSDEGNRRHTIRASPDSTWFEANFIVQHRVTTRVLPPGSGTVTIRPESPDGFYIKRTQYSLSAEPSPGSEYRFERWSPLSWWGRSENPIPPSHVSRVRGPDSYTAIFSEGPFFLINANVERIGMRLDDEWIQAPASVRPRSGRPVIRMNELQYPVGSFDWRFRFRSWSDGGDIAHAIEMPEGGSLTAEVTTEYRLYPPRVRGLGEVTVSRRSSDGYYPGGSQVVLTALPTDSFWRLSHWHGAESMFEPVQTLVMNSWRMLEAVFTTTPKIQPGERVNVRLSSYPSQVSLYTASSAYFVQVPPDASELTVNFRSLSLSRDHDLLMLVRRGQGVAWSTTNTREEVLARADHAFALPGRENSFTITPASDPPLEAGSYYLVPATFNQSRFINGILTVEITLGGAPEPSPARPVADPLAFTLVAPFGGDAPARPLRIANEGGSPLNYRVDSDISALNASPPMGSIPAGDTAVLDIAANAAGLLPDTYSGELHVVNMDESDSSEANGPAKLLTLPVTLVVLPPPDDEN